MDKKLIIYDFVGRGLYVAMLIAIGIISLFYYPRRIRQDVESGKLTIGQGKARLQKAKTVSWFLILFGILLTVETLFK
jgi:hypothetical protein